MRAATGGLVGPKGLAGAFSAVSSTMAAFAVATTGATTALALLTNRGGKVLNIQRSFAKATGQSQMAIRELRDATEGLISDYDLMQGMNRALALGAANNAKQFGELSRTAITLGRALGVDATFAMESLSLGIGRQSRLILDNLGLIVSVEKANRDYAATLRKTVAELTEAEKKEAFRTAAMEAARIKIDQLGGIQETNADVVTRLKVAYQNFRDELGMMVAASPAVSAFFTGLTTAAQDLAAVLRETFDPGRLGADLRTGMVRIATQSADANERYANSLTKTKSGLENTRDILLDRLGLEQDSLDTIRNQHEGWRGVINAALSLIPIESERIRLADELYATLQQIENTELMIKAAAKASANAREAALERTDEFRSSVENVNRLWQDMVGHVFAVGAAMETAFVGAVARDKIFPADLEEGIREDLERMADAAKEAAEDAKSEMKGTLEKGAIKATKNFDNIGKQAGQKLIDGIIQGSLDMEALLKSILGSLIQRALFSGILAFSPSRLGIQAGERLQQGIIRGMENTNRMLASSVTTGVTAALNRATPAANMTAQGPLMVNMPEVPQPVTPEAQAVNSYWLRTWTATARAAKLRGFRE
jgi:hypothetical protein